MTNTTVDMRVGSGIVDAGATQYRYPGAPPFGDSELDRRLFRGRNDEADLVLHSILSTNLFVLYGESGLGKTSLLNAGVLHELRARGCWPVSVRLNDTNKSPVDGIRDQIAEAGHADPTVDVIMGAPGESSSLWQLLGSLEAWQGNELKQPVVVFDQFEELFTLDWSDPDRFQFIGEFGEVVRGHRDEPTASTVATPPPDARFVLVIREDALGLLEELATDVPQIMRHRFRLGPLDPEQAEAAIREPGLVDDLRLGSHRFEYSEEAATEILDFLRTSSVRGVRRLATGVDPSQLQIVCHYVERAIVPQKSARGLDGGAIRIEASDLGGRTGLDRILSAFYRRSIDLLPSNQQGRVEQLCERGLISPSERRLSLEQDSIQTEFGVDAPLLQRLVDARLLRAEPRVGSVYYELAHDTLVPAILADRSARQARRRRRRRWLVATVAALLGAVLGGVIVASALRSDGTEGTGGADPGDQSAVALELDRLSTGSTGRTASFRIAEPATDRPMVVHVRPADGSNVAVDASYDANTTWRADRNPGGGAESLVVPPSSAGSPLEVRVTSQGQQAATFEIVAMSVDRTPVTPGAREHGAIRTNRDVAAFSVDVEDETMVVEVDADNSPSDARLEPLLDLVRPDGTVEQLTDRDASGSTEVELTSPGTHTIVIRGEDDSTGAFEISTEAVRVLSAGDDLEDVLANGSDVVLLELRASGAVDLLMTAPTTPPVDAPSAAAEVSITLDSELPAEMLPLWSWPRSRQLWSFELDGEPVRLRVHATFDSDEWEVPLEVAARGRATVEPDTGPLAVDGFAVFTVDVANGEVVELSTTSASGHRRVEVFSIDSPGTAPGEPLVAWDLTGDALEPSLAFDRTGSHAVIAIPADSAARAVDVQLSSVEPYAAAGELGTFTGRRRFYVDVTNGDALAFAVRPVRQRESYDEAPLLLPLGVIVEARQAADGGDNPDSRDDAPNVAGPDAGDVVDTRSAYNGDAIGVTLGCGAGVAGERSIQKITVDAYAADDVHDEYSVTLADWAPPAGFAPDGECSFPALDGSSTGIVTPTIADILTRAGASPEQSSCITTLWLRPAPGITADPEPGFLLDFYAARSITQTAELEAAVNRTLAGILDAGQTCGIGADDPIALNALERAYDLADPS